MDARPEPGDGFTVPDGVALVVGAAVASVHMRAALPSETIDATGWVVLWVTLAGVGLTAAGPFVFLVRRYGRRPSGYPRVGDWLWLMLGLPWLIVAILPPGDAASLVLGMATTLVSMIALGKVWANWVAPPPDAVPKFAASWTDRVGMVLAVAWPLQWGFVLVVQSR